MKAFITRNPGALFYEVRLQGTSHTALALTGRGARRLARRMIRQYRAWGDGEYKAEEEEQ